MPYLIGAVPTLFRILVRQEYTLNLEEGHGEYIAADAIGVRCVRGQSLYFQCILGNGAAFLLPVEALVWKPCELPEGMDAIQPWDCMASDFGVAEFGTLARGGMVVMPGKVRGQYRFSIDFTGTDLADDAVQHKMLHIAYLETGLIGAFPNNRVLWVDPALRDVPEESPRLRSLAYEFRAEGFQDIFGSRQRRQMPGRAEIVTPAAAPAAPKPAALPRNGVHTDPAERPEWMRNGHQQQEQP